MKAPKNTRNEVTKLLELRLKAIRSVLRNFEEDGARYRNMVHHYRGEVEATETALEMLTNPEKFSRLWKIYNNAEDEDENENE
jgi:hypothetical protein